MVEKKRKGLIDEQFFGCQPSSRCPLSPFVQGSHETRLFVGVWSDGEDPIQKSAPRLFVFLTTD